MQLHRFHFCWLLCIIALAAPGSSADPGEGKERRLRASRTFSDGILLLHSKTTTNDADDGYREEPAFYYLTGLENLPSAILAIDGKGGDSWLFLDTKRSGDLRPGAETERNLDIQHVGGLERIGRFSDSTDRDGISDLLRTRAHHAAGSSLCH
jgi:Aminopeptidase P, N-terminal domain